MARKREVNAFNISFLDLLSGALGAVIILFIAVPKAKEIQKKETPIAPKMAKTIEKEKPNQPRVQKLAKKKQIEEKEKIADQLDLQIEKYIDMHERALAEVEQLKSQIKSMKDEQKQAAKKQVMSRNVASTNFDTGFNFRGKKIVFLLDISGSMSGGDLIGQVKAGLKMLITSMGKDYEIDLVVFPGDTRKTRSFRPYSYLFGGLVSATKQNKEQLFKYLYGLAPRGGTPTGEALEYALKNYSNATDIVVFSDGAPSSSISPIMRGNYFDILRGVRKLNRYGIQINSVGLGKDFLTDKQSPRYQFLFKLAQENGGFFYGF